MAVTTDQMHAVFLSIDASLKLLVAHFGAEKQAAQPAAGRAVPRIAPDSELDGPRGNPKIRARPPRDWTGSEDFIGLNFSDCPPEYLDLLAERFDYFNEAETDAKKRGYNANDAARARGWSQRKRNGWTAPAQEPAAFPSDAPAPMTDEDIAF